MRKGLFVFISALALFAPVMANAQVPPPPADPANYYSPSGEYLLRSVPLTKDHSSPSRYTLTKRGREIWRRTYPFQLQMAAVSDKGIVAGYGLSRDGKGAAVFIFRSDGSILSENQTKWVSVHQPDSPPLPYLSAISASDKSDSLLVLAGADSESSKKDWVWHFSLSTGKLVSKFDFKDLAGKSRSALSIKLIPGTGLRLISDDDSEVTPSGWIEGVGYLLLSGDDKVLWRKDFPRSLGVSFSPEEQRRSHLFHIHETQIRPNREFGIWSPAEEKTYFYAIKGSPNNLSVVQVGSSIDEKEVVKPVVTRIATPIRTMVLPLKNAPIIGDVASFAMTEEDDPVFFRNNYHPAIV
jgi:hypothetical protein